MAYVDENLNDPTLYFETLLWTGDGSSPRTLSGLDFQPDLVWGHRRDDDAGHNLFDSVRTAGSDKNLQTNGNGAEGGGLPGTYGYLSAFTSDGFTVTQGSNTDGGAYWNINTGTYSTWNWKESATAGFDIVAYTGNGTADTSISHSLSAIPKMMIIKNRSGAHAWMVYHESLGYNSGTIPRFLQINNTNAQNNGGSGDFPAPPTSSVFKVGSYDTMNKNTDSIIAYLWSEKQGFSKFGAYTGNGADDGIYVHLGFSPAWIMIKSASASNSYTSWVIYDNKRKNFNQNDGDNSNPLYANKSAKEGERGNGSTDISGNACAIDFLSNGFKCRDNANEINTSGDKYVYMAFAEQPFVNSNGVPANAR